MAQARMRTILGGLVMAGLVALGIGATIGAHRWKEDLRVGAVEIRGNRILASEEILRLAAVRPDTGLFDVDLRAIQQRLAAEPYIARAAVTRNVPDGITIEVTEREPVAILPAGRLLAIDAAGRVLPPARAQALFDLPVLTGIPRTELVAGNRLTGEGVREALLLVRMAQELGGELYRRISEVHVRTDGTLLVYTTESGVPVQFGSGGLARKLVTFDGFWKAIVGRRGATALRAVDLRYADQVVVRWQ